MNFLRACRYSIQLFNIKVRSEIKSVPKRTDKLKIFKRKYMYDADLRKEVTQDVLLYRNDVTSFHQLLQGATVINYIVWVWLSSFALSYLQSPDPEVLKADISKKEVVDRSSYGYKFFEKIASFTAMYKYYIIGFCCIVGYGTGFATSFYVTRNIHSIALKRGGDKVSIYTNAFIPTHSHLNEITVPLNHVSCQQSRQQSSAYIAMKIKNHSFYYLISKSGSFVSPELFDRSVGLKRL